MKILYGTRNEAKFDFMKRSLCNLNIELLSLTDFPINLPSVAENGNSPLDNARLKAKAYYQILQIPVFSCDTGLYFDELPNELQPGIHVRVVNGQLLNDDQMIDYYSELAKKYGDIVAHYCNGICFIKDDKHIYESMNEKISGDRFLITSKPHIKRNKGFPLDSLAIDPTSHKYYVELGANEINEISLKEGFAEFFESCIQ